MNALVKSQGRAIGFIVFCLCLQIGSAAQLKANFTVTSLSGCSPLIVYFSDQSVGSPTSWRWDLGNGVISTLKNPSVTYFNPGNYTIKLTVKNASGSDSIVKEQYLTVYANPVVNFSSPDTIGCLRNTTQFTDKSIAGSGSISKWEWDFGDGTISANQHPLHTYISAGSFNVSLKITNSFGCTKTVTKTQYVKINEGVRASFNINSTGLCTAPAAVQFTNTSTGSVASYAWNFGDGSTSSAINPSHTYSTNGSYSITLVAISTQGCRDTLKKEKALNIGTNRSDFSTPSLICEGQPIHFTNTSSPLPSSARWNFGGGSFSDSIHPVKTFTTSGNYTVKLINDFGSCKDSVSKQITVVDKPRANFDAGTKLFCSTPANVQFHSSSANAASYFWIFGDGTSSVAANPIHTYNNFGNFSVTLIVTNVLGCSDTVIKKDFIQIQKPQIELTGLPKSGCVPLTVTPTANIVSNQTIASYLWKFGDGTNSTSATPQHTYTTAGVYSIILVITTQGGCKDSVTMISAVKVGNKPHAQFTASPGEVCNADPAHFIDNSTGDVDEWHWDFGDHLSSTDQNPSHVFNGLGQFTVSLITSSNGCADTITIKDAVNVLPPVSLFIIHQNCPDKYKVDFTDQSIGATRVEWDFGDGTASTMRDPSHRFARPGVYKIGLTTFSSTCSNYNYSYVKIVDEKPKIVIDKNTICKGSSVSFSCPSVIDSNIVSWRWDIGDGIYTGSKFSHTYSNTGTYKIVLTITDVNGCISSDTTEVNVYGSKADFSVSRPSACLKENAISFTNTSSTDGAHAIVKSIWNFGDKRFDSTNNSPIHQYQQAGSYTISLMVKDSYGCTDEMVKNAAVAIAQPVASFYSLDTMSCIGKNISFINSSSAINAEYQWSFNDGIISASSDPIHTFDSTGLYTVKLSVTDQYGCKDSVTKKDYINISLPEAKFIVSDSAGNCPPLIVNFTNGSSSFVDIKWDFGDGNISTLANPVHYYNTAGTFYAKLIVTGPGGCTDTAIKKIVVKGPSGTFSYTPIAGCNPMAASFNATTQNTTAFVWDFSDGNTVFGNGSSITHEYTNAGEYVPKIILTDAAGCNVPIVGPDTIHVYQVIADFISNINSLCKAGFVQFTNKSISNDLITNYQWNFGDGSISNEANPSHFYKAAGSYTVKLTASTRSGCTGTITLTNTLTVLPAPSIDIESVNEACAGTHIGFNAIVKEGNASELKWQWNLGNGKTASTQSVLPQLYSNARDVAISVIATASNGCTDTAIKKLSIRPLPSTNAGNDEWICLGATTQLHVTGAETYKWDAVSSLSCITCANPTASPDKTTAYVVAGFNQFGCSSKDSVLILVQQPFALKASADDTICMGEPVRLSANGADVYSWYPSTGMQNSNIANTIAVPQTTTTYHVIGKDNHNCFSDTAAVFIKVWPIPTVNAGADQTVVVGNSLQLKTSNSNDVTSWQWFGGGALSCSTCSTTLVSPKQTTTYKVVVKNDGGCSAGDEITVNVICNNGNLFVPNTFSPNGDGMNDKFYPSGTGINRIKSLRVFNRWGEIVFEKINFSANDASSGWDGKYKGELLASDVYIWSCEVICENNEVLPFKGDVTLLR